MSDGRPLFVECGNCGERWQIATLPIPSLELARIELCWCCPRCSERREIYLCYTDGPGAVSEPRDGALPERGQQ